MKTAVIEKTNGMLVLVSFDGVWVETTAVRSGKVWHHEIHRGAETDFNAAVRMQQH